MSDVNLTPENKVYAARFLQPGQASAHVAAWLLDYWFWTRFHEDRLDGESLPPRILLLRAGRHAEE